MLYRTVNPSYTSLNSATHAFSLCKRLFLHSSADAPKLMSKSSHTNIDVIPSVATAHYVIFLFPHWPIHRITLLHIIIQLRQLHRLNLVAM